MTDQSLLMDFIAETGEHLEQIERGLLALEQDPEDREVLNDVFRSVHTIKGSSEYLGMVRIAELTHKLENLLDDIRQGKRLVDDGLIDLLMAAGDRIGLLVEDLERDRSEQAQIDDLLEQIEALEQAGSGQDVAEDGGDVCGQEVGADEGGVVEEGEFYEEEYDEELFEIFIDQLSDGLAEIVGQARRMWSGDVDGDLVAACRERLEALRSSANYMGYDRLTEVYDQWLEAVDEAGTLYGEGGQVDWRQVVEQTMVPMIDKVTGFFPKVEKLEGIAKDIKRESSDEEEKADKVELSIEDIAIDEIEQDSVDTHREAEKEDPGADAELDIGEELEFDSDEDDERSEELSEITEKSPEVSASDQSLLMDFIAETGEHLEQIERGLLALEQDPEDREVLNDVFRSVHTIKGSSEYLGMVRIAELTHKLENLLDDIRQGKRLVDDGLIDLLMAAGDRIGLLVEDLERDRSEQAQIDDLLEQIEALEQAGSGQDVAEDGGDVCGQEVGADEGGVVEEGEFYEEEYDEELFEIFIDQLSDGLAEIVGQARRMWSGDVDGDLVAACRERLEALRSSANYMGYDRLTEVYDQWLEAVDEAGTLYGEGGQVDWRQVVEQTMVPMIDKVTGFFSKIEKIQALDLSILEQAAGEPDREQGTPPEIETVSLEDLGIDLEGADLEEVELESTDEDNIDVVSRLENALEEKLDALRDSEDEEVSEDMETGLFSTDGIIEDFESALETGPTPEEIEDIETELLSGGVIAGIDVEAAVDEPEDAEVESREAETEQQSVTAETVLPHVEEGDRRSRFSLGRRRSDKIKEKLLKHSIRVDAQKIDTLMNQVGELVVSRAWFSQLFNEMRDLQQELHQSKKLDQKELKHVKELTLRISEATTALGRVANELQEGVMKVRMLPIEQLFSRYPRLVHDLVRDSGKRVHLEILGEETELDKVVIEEIADPLVHILRNAIDHGLEPPAERIAKGKPETGTLRLHAYHESNHVVIEVADDGRGIDPELIKVKALEKNFVTADELERMTEKEVLGLIMQPGFSTAAEVTHTSGRGVGMDVVKANIEKLNGTVEIESQKDLGTRFRVKIPLTLAIIPALLVKVSEELFTIPLSTVDETLRVYKNEVSTIEGIDVFQLRDATIPLIRLSELFDMQASVTQDERIFVVVVNTGVKRVGLVVDELIGREEVVIKPLEDYLQENSGFSGATILGDGSISLILDIYELVNLSIDKQAKRKTMVAPL